MQRMGPSLCRRLGSGAGAEFLAFVFATTAGAEGFFARGDADCSVRVTAADVVTTVRGLGGGGACGNDDCDRDGRVTPADVGCSAGCLFGECPVPAHAPRVTGVEPETASDPAPFATVRVTGVNFGSDDRRKRVTIDGQDAEVIEFVPPDELLAFVPPLAPGPAEVVMHDGDLVGFRALVTVGPQTPIGEPDTLDDTLDLLDAVAARFADLDLESHYGDDAALVRLALQGFRDDLAAQRAALAADPDFTAELRAALDSGFDSSGVPHRLRAILSDIEDLIAQTSPADAGPVRSGSAQGTLVVGAVLRISPA